MDSGFAPPPSYHAAVEVPPDIFQPLLKIAQLGYDANDVRNHYLVMLRHLRRMGADNAEAAYTLETSISDRKLPFSMEDDSSSVHQTTESTEDHVSPRTVPTGWSWSRSASYEPSIQEQSDLVASQAPHGLFGLSSEQSQQPQSLQDIQLQMPQQTPTQQSFNQAVSNRSQNILAASANYSPAPSTSLQLDANEIYGSDNETVAFAGHPRAQSSSWDFNGTNMAVPQPHPQPQFAPPWPSMQAPYQVAMSNTQMPLLVPYHHPQPPPPPQRSYTDGFGDDLVNPFSSGLGLSQLATELYNSPFFPTIDVIPSRKRRKVLKTGVKRIAQSLQNTRQASI